MQTKALAGVNLAFTPHLSPRERQVVILIMEAAPIKEIAVKLGISRNTVSQYLADLYAKVGVHTRAELTLWAFREGLVSFEKDEDVA